MKSLALVALTGGPFLVGPLNGDKEVANRSQLENLPLVLRHLNEDQWQGLLCPGEDHPGHLDRFQALVHQVRLDILETDLDRDGSQNGSECFRLGESGRVKGHFPLLEQEAQGSEVVGGTRVHPDTIHAWLRLREGHFDASRMTMGGILFSAGGFCCATGLAGADPGG
ncbi:hypothetical protein MTP99_013078 [Tenebrio molitor]|jgi:hypothetical protein|nr:hypothetical protein MTP99_013078 [Tenebrio molitor]